MITDPNSLRPPTSADITDAPSIFIANFGIGNHLWPRCLQNSTVETFSHLGALPFIENHDKEGFIAHAIKYEKTAKGISPTKSVASRWFNVSKIFESTSGDLWIHRSGDDIWWTLSTNFVHSKSVYSSHAPEAKIGEEVLHTAKPTRAWSRQDLRGRRLSWKAAHPKARHFLATEATLQELSPDYAKYAIAMICGENLSSWHELPIWKKTLAESSKGEISIATALQNAAARMAMTAWETTKSSFGQKVERTVKNKEFEFSSKAELEEYLADLIESQQGLCAISSMPLQYDGTHDDIAMLCSLDRIDSEGHYSIANLQVVCRFINAWKSDAKDEEFRRLLHTVRGFRPSVLDA